MTSSKPFIAAWICEELFPVYAWRYCLRNQKSLSHQELKTHEMLTTKVTQNDITTSRKAGDLLT